MENKKTTKKEFFGMLKEMVVNGDAVNKEELLSFIDHEVELINRKAENRKNETNKRNIENEKLTTLVIDELRAVGKSTITELLTKSSVLANYKTEEGKPLSNQKLSALLKPLYVGYNPVINRIQENSKTVTFQVND